tara:strand:- start:204 stop:398 length:195 start_codon:yes stop_codon:yes gene_type:complete
MLGKVAKEWTAGAFVVSFKLETDDQLIQEKVEKVIELVDDCSPYNVAFFSLSSLDICIKYSFYF